MTPDQLKAYVDGALARQDWHSIFFVVIAATISFFGAWFGAYAREKGKNFATKEDIGEITQAVESVKTKFTGQIESLKANLEARRHYSQLRYERERAAYEAIWQRIFDAHRALTELQVFDGTHIQPLTGEDQNKKLDRIKNFAKHLVEIYECVSCNRPFYPEPIYIELHSLVSLFTHQGIFHLSPDDGKSAIEFWATVGQKQQEFENQFIKVCDSIRKRLTEFDTV